MTTKPVFDWAKPVFDWENYRDCLAETIKWLDALGKWADEAKKNPSISTFTHMRYAARQARRQLDAISYELGEATDAIVAKGAKE